MPESFAEKGPIPFNENAEASTLGALLLGRDNGEAYETAVGILRSEDFYKFQNKIIFQAIIEFHEANPTNELDMISLIDVLKKKGNLEKAGGSAYVAALTSSVPSSANIEHHAKIVLDCSIRRLVLFTAESMLVEAKDEAITPKDILESAEKKIFEINDSRQRGEILKISSIIEDLMEHVEKRLKNKGQIMEGVPSGFHLLDKMIPTGMRGSELIIIGARPSIGKTSLALSLINHIVMGATPHAAVFFSLEMPGLSIGERLLSMVSGIPLSNIRVGSLNHNEMSRITQIAGRIHSAPLLVDDTAGINLLDLRARARRAVRTDNVEIIFIDYISLIASMDRSVARHEQVAEVSRSLKALARELDVPIVVLSQVSRDSENREPQLNDLRESGSIEQDADIVIFLHRKRPQDQADKEEHEKDYSTKIIVAKNRNGATGVVNLMFKPETASFLDIVDR